MEKKIEIFENTLLKLLVRRGSDLDRQNIILSQGELGYTTDTKRLFVGDGQTAGGIITGNKYLGSSTDVTSFTNATQGDFALNTASNKFFIFNGGLSTDINNWLTVGGIYTSGNNTIVVEPSTNKITVGTLSASNFSADAVGNSLQIDNNGRIALNPTTILTNSITTNSSPYLGLPGNVSFNNVNYNWPVGGTGSNLFLQTDIAGNLSWTIPSAPTTTFVATSAGQIPVGTIVPFSSSTNAPYGWMLCNGQTLSCNVYPALSAVIGYTYGGSGNVFKVPDLINKSLYGVSSSPSTSTTFRVASGTNSTLSAAGTFYIIKAIPDIIVNSKLTINSGLTASVNGVNVYGASVSPLSGNISIGLPEIINSQSVQGGSSFTVDSYGRVTDVVGLSSAIHPAGEITTVDPTNTQVYNAYSPISFLRTPSVIVSQGSYYSCRTTISAYPYITNSDGVSAAQNIPSNAKNIILDCNIYKSSPDSGSQQDKYIVAAPNLGLLESTEYSSVGVNEYLVACSRASGSGDSIRSGSQVIVPLSASNTGVISFGLRINTSRSEAYTVRIVGYTL